MAVLCPLRFSPCANLATPIEGEKLEASPINHSAQKELHMMQRAGCASRGIAGVLPLRDNRHTVLDDRPRCNPCLQPEVRFFPLTARSLDRSLRAAQARYEAIVERSGNFRFGLDWTDKYPSAIAALAHLKAKTAYIDGRTLWRRRGRIAKLRLYPGGNRRRARGAASLLAFDLLHLDGRTELPLVDHSRRKAFLA